MNTFLDKLLFLKPKSITQVHDCFQKSHDELTIELGWFYFRLVSLMEMTLQYAESRIIYEKPMIDMIVVQKKISNAKFMILIFKNILISKVEVSAIFLFVKSVLLEVIEELLQLNGAYGYCRESAVSQCWVDCRNSFLRLSEKFGDKY